MEGCCAVGEGGVDLDLGEDLLVDLRGDPWDISFSEGSCSSKIEERELPKSAMRDEMKRPLTRTVYSMHRLALRCSLPGRRGHALFL